MADPHARAEALATAIQPLRHIWLCADDYGISPAVSQAIRDLIELGRINATSVMVIAPSFHRSEAVALNLLRAHGADVAIGLHLTLSAPFEPMTAAFAPLHNKAFPSYAAMLAYGALRRLDRAALEAEIAAQIRMFVHRFERAPDYIDGHQHVHVFPQVADALLAVAREHAPGAWIRQCGRLGELRQRIGDPKGMVLDVLSRRFRRLAAARGYATNPAFAGTYDFRPGADFAALFARFLHGLPEGGLVMCHPGRVDAELTRLDPLTELREREYDFFRSAAFPALLASAGVALARPEVQAARQ